MILKNKRTREILNIKLPEFNIRFAKEIKTAFESYNKQNWQSHILKQEMSMNTIFTLTGNGTLIIMPVLIGILRKYNLCTFLA